VKSKNITVRDCKEFENLRRYINVNCFQNTHKSSIPQSADMTTLIMQVLTAVVKKSYVIWGPHGVISQEIKLQVKIKISLLQVMEAYRVARGQGFHIT
jgi:hypothetical protein